eukprot:11176306-Lingulodinium_polyedra.AAC.1
MVAKRDLQEPGKYRDAVNTARNERRACQPTRATRLVHVNSATHARGISKLAPWHARARRARRARHAR